jgi:hypothetical protein
MANRGAERYRAGKRLWNPGDDRILRAIYPDTPTADVARQLRRTLCAVYGRAQAFGLTKSAAYLASPDACRLRCGDHVGAAYWYPKGHVPANKGLRRPGYAPGRMRETQFKPGTRSGTAAAHHMAVGSTRLVEGYVYRKVSDVPNVPYTVNWKAEHHLIWVAAHGPIPPGHKLRFLNGDRMDVRLENLELTTHRAMMLRNSMHTLPPALAKTLQLLGALNRQIRRRTPDEKQDR